ncbi:RAB12 [Symbiodinium sp. KB8]|nr:RAB12 [Symbiodinium sp. KB8]
MYTVRLLQLSGSSFTEFELAPSASIGEVLERARGSLGCDPNTRLQLLFEDRPLETQETLASLGLPGPPFQVDLQLLQLQQPRLVERIDMQTSDFQRVDIGICGQRGAGKTSFLNQYVDHRFHAERFQSVISVDFSRVANLRVAKDDSENMVPVKLLLWDLHGIHNASNPVLHPSMFRRKAAIIFVADLERLHLYEIQSLLDLSASEAVSERVLVGNKADVAKPGATEAVEAFAAKRGLWYFEASAKDHESVEAVLRHTLLSVMDKLELNLTPFRRDRVLAPDPPPERSRCALQ